MNLADAPRGVLRINAPMTFGTQHLAPAIPAFLDLYPDIEMDLVLNDRIVDLIAEGFDAGVRITSMADSSLVARRIAPSRHIVCAAPAYLEKHGRPTVPDDLRDHNCLGYSYRARGADWTVIGPDGPVSVPVRGGLRTNNGDVLRTAALAGLGIVAAPTFNVGDDLRSGRLVALFEEAAPATHAIYAVYPHRRHVLPKVRAFVDFLAARLGPEPYWDR